MRHFLRITFWSGLGFLVFGGIITAASHGDTGAHTAGYYIGGGIFILGAALLFVCLVGLIGFFGVSMTKTGWDAMDALQHPVPSPPEIELALYKEWGRPPTVEEVNAVYQMLHTEQNQKLLAGGVALGAIYLMGHTLHNS